MEKVNMKSMDIVGSNIEKIGALFPNCITEVKNDKGELEHAIDFDKLKQELSRNLVDGNKERYEFTWPDKRQAIVTANAPISKTLRPCREKSVDFDHTQNVYIEGDNLDALKLMQETYLGKIKMIYIDPPYNTGNDFVYDDDFSKNSGDYLKSTGDADVQGNKLTANKDSNGRFHTDWLNMMYPRLKLAKDLLTDDGVIFISIDDNEVFNLKAMCNEIFGSLNFIAEFVVASNSSKNNAKWVSISHEYLICFAKSKLNLDPEWSVKKNNVDEYVQRVNQLLDRGLSKDEIHEELLELTKKPRFYDLDHFTYADEKGVYQTNDPGGVPNGNTLTEIIHPKTGKPCAKPSGGWRYKDEEIKRKVLGGEFEFGVDETIIPRPKRYLNEFLNQVPKSILFFDSQGSTKWLKKNGIPFDFPKSIDYLKYIISMVPNVEYVLDFFSGSASTAHAVFLQNLEDNLNRKFIMVQLPECVSENSEAFKAGFNNLCQIGENRIKIAGDECRKQGLLASSRDFGFRVFKIDDSNMKDIYYKPDEFQQDLLSSVESNIKEDRTPEDLLFQVMIDDFGIPLSAKIETLDINGKKVFNVEDGHLVACFDSGVTDEVVTNMAKLEPNYAVLRDSSYESDSVAANFEQIFKKFSPSTITKIL